MGAPGAPQAPHERAAGGAGVALEWPHTEHLKPRKRAAGALEWPHSERLKSRERAERRSRWRPRVSRHTAAPE
jgi:hypothetical protein